MCISQMQMYNYFVNNQIQVKYIICVKAFTTFKPFLWLEIRMRLRRTNNHFVLVFTNFNPLKRLEGKLRLGRTKQNAPYLFLLC